MKKTKILIIGLAMSTLLCGCGYNEPKDTSTETYLYIDEDSGEAERIVIDPSKVTKEYDGTYLLYMINDRTIEDSIENSKKVMKNHPELKEEIQTTLDSLDKIKNWTIKIENGHILSKSGNETMFEATITIDGNKMQMYVEEHGKRVRNKDPYTIENDTIIMKEPDATFVFKKLTIDSITTDTKISGYESVENDNYDSSKLSKDYFNVNMKDSKIELGKSTFKDLVTNNVITQEEFNAIDRSSTIYVCKPSGSSFKIWTSIYNGYDSVPLEDCPINKLYIDLDSLNKNIYKDYVSFNFPFEIDDIYKDANKLIESFGKPQKQFVSDAGNNYTYTLELPIKGQTKQEKYEITFNYINDKLSSIEIHYYPTEYPN